MVHHIRFTFDSSIQELMNTDDIIQLTESLQTFIDAGVISCEEDEEIFINHSYLKELALAIERLRVAGNLFGRDDLNLISYPFNKRNKSDGN